MEKREIFKRVEYLTTCISAFGERFNLTNAESYHYLKRYTGIDFLIECYEAEHTLSIEDAVDDLKTLCLNHGGKLQ